MNTRFLSSTNDKYRELFLDDFRLPDVAGKIERGHTGGLPPAKLKGCPFSRAPYEDGTNVFYF